MLFSSARTRRDPTQRAWLPGVPLATAPNPDNNALQQLACHSKCTISMPCASCSPSDQCMRTRTTHKHTDHDSYNTCAPPLHPTGHTPLRCSATARPTTAAAAAASTDDVNRRAALFRAAAAALLAAAAPPALAARADEIPPAVEAAESAVVAESAVAAATSKPAAAALQRYEDVEGFAISVPSDWGSGEGLLPGNSSFTGG